MYLCVYYLLNEWKLVFYTAWCCAWCKLVFYTMLYPVLPPQHTTPCRWAACITFFRFSHPTSGNAKSEVRCIVGAGNATKKFDWSSDDRLCLVRLVRLIRGTVYYMIWCITNKVVLLPWWNYFGGREIVVSSRFDWVGRGLENVAPKPYRCVPERAKLIALCSTRQLSRFIW